MDRRKRTARTVALMSLFSMTETQENVPVASFDGDGSDLVSLIVGLEPMQAGSGDPSPDNVRPISGWTEAKVTRTGKNLFDPSKRTSYGSGKGQRWYESEGYMLRANQAYTFSVTYANPIALYIRDKATGDNLVNGNPAVTYTPTADTVVYFQAYRGEDISSVDTFQLELGSSASSYEPYQGETYTIPLGTTVYGATIDVVNGKVYARPYYPSYNGETLVGPWISSMDKYEEGATPTTGAQVVDMGGTVTEISLTPTQVTTLIGTNNIWADTGEIKYIEYNV